MLQVGAAAVQYDVRFFDPLTALAVANQQAKRLLPALPVTDPVLFQKTAPAHVHDMAVSTQAIAQQRCPRQGLEVLRQVLFPGNAVSFGRKLVRGIFRLDQVASERRARSEERRVGKGCRCWLSPW